MSLLCSLASWYAFASRSYASFKLLKALGVRPRAGSLLVRGSTTTSGPGAMGNEEDEEAIIPLTRISDNDKARVKEALQFWTVYAAVVLFETYVEFLVSWLPLYFYAKLALLLWMANPESRGAVVAFEKFLAPRLLPYVHWAEQRIHPALVKIESMVGAVGVDVVATTDHALEMVPDTKLEELARALEQERQRRGSAHRLGLPAPPPMSSTTSSVSSSLKSIFSRVSLGGATSTPTLSSSGAAAVAAAAEEEEENEEFPPLLPLGAALPSGSRRTGSDDSLGSFVVVSSAASASVAAETGSPPRPARRTPPAAVAFTNPSHYPTRGAVVLSTPSPDAARPRSRSPTKSTSRVEAPPPPPLSPDLPPLQFEDEDEAQEAGRDRSESDRIIELLESPQPYLRKNAHAAAAASQHQAGAPVVAAAGPGGHAAAVADTGYASLLSGPLYATATAASRRLSWMSPRWPFQADAVDYAVSSSSSSSSSTSPSHVENARPNDEQDAATTPNRNHAVSPVSSSSVTKTRGPTSSSSSSTSTSASASAATSTLLGQGAGAGGRVRRAATAGATTTTATTTTTYVNVTVDESEWRSASQALPASSFDDASSSSAAPLANATATASTTATGPVTRSRARRMATR